MPPELITQIFQIVHEAGNGLIEYQKKALTVEYKKDEFDPVTIADRNTDDFLRARLGALFPGDSFITEESAAAPKNYDGRVWMIDPLDGTKDFIAGRDCFAIHIGLLEGGIPKFGLVAVPRRGQIFSAVKGEGAFKYEDGKSTRLKVSDVTDIHEARLLTRYAGGEIRPIEEDIARIPFKQRIPEGSMGIKICMVASGEAEVFIPGNFNVGKWDTLAPEVILKEAGGLLTDLNGAPLNYSQASRMWDALFVAANNLTLQSQVLGYLKKDPASESR